MLKYIKKSFVGKSKVDRCKELFSTIDKLCEKYIRIWEAVCNLESPTENKAAVDACAGYIAFVGKELGFSVRSEREELSGDPVCIVMNEEAAGLPVVFSGHVDTVHKIGSFGTPAVYFDGDEIHGPGVTDCKGGVVAALLAMEALSSCGFKSRPVKLILQTDEETSSAGSKKRTVDFMETEAKGAVAFLNCEGAERGKVTLWRKGILRYDFDIKGIVRHSAICQDGASAVREAAYKIIELEAWKDKDGITCNCGIIEGGTVPNSVPERCRFTADIRYKTSLERELVEKRVTEIAEKSYVEGTECRLVKVSERVSMQPTDASFSLLEKVRRISLECGFGDLTPVSRTGGSDAADMTERGIATLDSLGVFGGYIHSVKEYAFVSSLAYSAKRLAAIAMLIED